MVTSASIKYVGLKIKVEGKTLICIHEDICFEITTYLSTTSTKCLYFCYFISLRLEYHQREI